MTEPKDARMTTATPKVYAAFLAVLNDIDSIGKTNQIQSGPARFKFRGVDDVMNAMHGPMAKHGLICVPQVQERIPETRATSNGGTMNVVHLRVRFSFFADDGSTFNAEAWGEGQDSGDKATGKAHSMAYKSALLQAFHVPTEDTPDADRDTTPAGPVARTPERQAKADLWTYAQDHGYPTVQALSEAFAAWSGGLVLADAQTAEISGFHAHLMEQAV